MVISKESLLEHRERGPWCELESIAQKLYAYTKKHGGDSFNPKLGGGTRLMLALNHRISDDINLFVDSPGWLPYVSPRLNDDLENKVSSYQEESNFVKLRFEHGEIDFIVSPSLLSSPDLWNPCASETSFTLEPPAEVLAKRLFYRGWALSARDLFDWAYLDALSPEDAIFPHEEIARLLSSKLDGIEQALSRLVSTNKKAQSAWSNIRTPLETPSLDDASKWALSEIERYREITRSVSVPRPNGMPTKYRG